ncbi:inner membrane CreD family protein, partial [Treponema sp.]|uniref:inner membrane CreD family protein n=1 Tax=Treponema sp. TaxID=166 RepID=UPI0038904B45
MKKLSPLTVKLFGIGFIVLLLLIGNVLINSKLEDREYSYHQALNSIETAAGGKFNSEGPYIAVPYEADEVEEFNNKTTTRKVTRYYYIHPESLRYETDLTSEKRTVGIYSAPVFKGSVKILADFKIDKNFSKIYSPENAFIILKISDRSLQNKPVYKINGKNVETHLTSGINLSGLTGNINLEKGNYHFETELKIHGSTTFSVDVSAADTFLSVKSDWSSPGFTRFDYLPDSRIITKDGFEAEWTLPFAADNENHKIGFDFVDPVNVYQKLDRAVSYGFLFIIVPFIVLFMFEALAKVNLHAVHYLLS